jgi:Ca2+-binding RTX toxin-like protein
VLLTGVAFTASDNDRKGVVMRVKLLGVSLVGLLGLVVVSIAAAKVINGTDGDDTLPGTARADLIQGLGGNDRIAGRGGPDILLAGKGNDLVRGGYGGDVIWGNSGDDQLHGGPGNDVVRGRGGNDEIYGGEGADQLYAGFGADDVHGGRGPDTLYAVARDQQLDKLDCGPGNDVAVVRAGEQTAIVNCESVKVVPDSASPEEPGETPAND